MKLEFYIEGEKINPPKGFKDRKIEFNFASIEFNYSVVAIHYGIPETEAEKLLKK